MITNSIMSSSETNSIFEEVQSISKYTYKWKITKFSEVSKMATGVSISSGNFVSSCGTKSRNWELKLYPGGETEASRSHLSIFLYSQETFDVTAECRFAIMNARGNKIAYAGPLFKKTFSRLVSGWGRPLFMNRSSVLDKQEGMLTDNDELILLCEINMSILNDGQEPIEFDRDNPYKLDILNGYERILNNEKNRDVQFIVEDKILYAHKLILSNQSSVFAAMFEHQMKENVESKVSITDITYEVLLELFRFIYCGKVQKLEKHAKDLLVAAEKYDISKLKTMCEEYIYQILSVENALEYFTVAGLHNAVELKDKIKNFMVQHAKEMIKQPSFKAVTNLPKDLVFEVIIALASRD